jgi:RNA polymerase sigma-70 factor (ECF subfamily)
MSHNCRPRKGPDRYSRFLPSPTLDLALIDRLRGGDEQAFDELIRAEGPAMLRIARLFVGSEQVAEEIVQETWLRVLRSLDTFEERSSLRTWIHVILGNVARTRGEREGRSTPLASLQSDAESTVPEERFFPSSHPRWAGMWSTLVDSWEAIPDDRLLAGETQAKLREALTRIPARYAAVFTLRDIEGWPADEVCTVLGLTAENQRVLLHRARSRIRALLEEYLG